MTIVDPVGRAHAHVLTRLEIFPMRLVHSKSPVSVDNECATVSLMKSYSACDHACPALADGNVELMCTFIYNFYDLNDLELTLGNRWELAPPQRVDSLASFCVMLFGCVA